MKSVHDIPLRDNERKAIREAVRRLKADLPVSRVILFGSKARGTSRPDSDIDLLVLTHVPVTTKLERDVSDLLYDIDLENDVVTSDVVVSETDWTEGVIHYHPFHDEVQRDGVLA